MKKFILSIAVLLMFAQFSNAQCVPTGALDCATFTDQISKVVFGTINNTTGCSAGGYTVYAQSTNVTQTNTYPISVTAGASGDRVGVWIDYNQNAVFDATEFTLVGSAATDGQVLTTNITIPGTATPGTTKMRVRLIWSTTQPAATNACASTATWGEVEDYSVNIISNVACAGTPAPGNTVATPATLCAGASTVLSAQNATAGSGVTYVWSSSPTGVAGSFTPIPTATSSTYTATPSASTYYQVAVTCSAGPATGTSTPVQVVVNPLPVVTVSPATSCGSPTNTLTASGANTYTWTPTTGLTPAAGNSPTEIANPSTTTTYTVTGRITATGCQSTATALVNSSSTAAVISSPPSFSYQITESFEAAPAGWTVQNNSVLPVGTWGITTAATLAPPPFGTGYAVTNYTATGATGATGGTISNWLLSPVINIKNGDQISFYTRTSTGAPYADRLEVRISTNGASGNVGTLPGDVGDFTTLVMTVNPNQVAGAGTGTGTSGYPDTWTKLTGTVTGITGTVSGRLGFRYFVTDGGAAGNNSNIIGLDMVQYGTPIGVTCAGTVSNLTVNITGGVGPYTLVYSDGTTNYTYNGYNSGAPINVTPSVSTNYTIVSVTSANGCVGSGNSGTAAITITPPTAVTTPPASITNICVGGNANITVGTNNPAGASTYVWEVSTNGGTSYSTVTNVAPYSGATTNTLTITGATAGMNGYLYRAKVTGLCGPATITTTASTLSVNTPAVITAPLAAGNFSACTGSATTTSNTTNLSVTATGNALTYQWQVNTGAGFANVTNGANYAGATTSTLSIINPTAAFIGYQYRVLVSSGGCASVTSAIQTLTVVNTLPVVVISASPNTTVTPQTPVVLTAAVSSATSPITYQWYWNNTIIPGATGQTYTVNPNQPGDYSVSVKDANGCSAVTSLPLTITLGAGPSTVLFISPSPNSGVFNVRYFNSKATPTATEQALLNVFDEKGSRVFTQRYILTGPYTQMRVDMGSHGSGIYRVELSDNQGNRIQTGSVMVF